MCLLKLPLALDGLNDSLFHIVYQDGRLVVWWPVTILVHSCTNKGRGPSEVNSALNVAFGVVADHPDGGTEELGCFGSGEGGRSVDEVLAKQLVRVVVGDAIWLAKNCRMHFAAGCVLRGTQDKRTEGKQMKLDFLKS